MKTILLTTMVALSAYSMMHGNTTQDSVINTAQDSVITSSALQVTDTVQGKALNDIRFDGWGRSEWLDNEYIRTLRKYLDDYNAGKVSNPDLDPYKEQIRGQFVIYDITPYFMGGAFIRITFLDMPDRVFDSWVYSKVDGEREVVESYEFRSISIEEERTDMTKEDILQAIRKMDGLKLW